MTRYSPARHSKDRKGLGSHGTHGKPPCIRSGVDVGMFPVQVRVTIDYPSVPRNYVTPGVHIDIYSGRRR